MRMKGRRRHLSSTSAARPRSRQTEPAVEMLEERRMLSVAPQIAGALSGKVLYTHGGHGYVYRDNSPPTNPPSWGVMRGYTQGMMEDLGNQDQLEPYAEYALHAGASVASMRPIGHQVNEDIVDNSDQYSDATGGYEKVSGTWGDSTNSTYWSNNDGKDDVHYTFASTASTETAVSRFTANIPAAGFYPVYTWVNPGTDSASNDRTNDQVYRIKYAGGSYEAHIATSKVGRGWVYLGTYYFNAGVSKTAGSVEVSNKSAQTGKVVIADAIRFGNGMGDVNYSYTYPGGVETKKTYTKISGQPRENEAALYWLYASRGWTSPGVRVAPSVVYGGTTIDDETKNFSAMLRYAAYMNNGGVGPTTDRLWISFHTNAGGGRGTLGLITNDSTPHQATLANLAGSTVESEMIALNSTHESNWFQNAANTFSGGYSEIDDSVANSEMDATIIEVAYHDDATDAALLKDPQVRYDVGRASYHTAIKYFDQFDTALTNTTYLPEPPTNLRATTDANGNVILNWSAGPSSSGETGPYGNAATGYRVWTSTNGYGFDLNSTISGGGTLTKTISGLSANAVTYFKVTATNAGGESLGSWVVAAKPQAGRRAPILIVNNFSRLDRAGDQIESHYFGSAARARIRYNNSHDYVVQAGEAIENYNSALGIETVTDAAVAAGQVNLANYHTVIWMSGEQSTDEETFSSVTQPLVTSFLNGGGKLFVSGAEVAWDLFGQAAETAADQAFLNNTLHANYVNDDSGTHATAAGIAGTALAGVTALSFDNGTHGTYDVDFPDTLSANGAGAAVAMNYSGGTGGGAAVQYASGNTKLIFMGFPFESIYTASQRNSLMTGVLNFFGTASTIISTTPGAPDLLAASDTGNSSTDNLTNRDNSAAGTTLQFSVPGTVAGATVTLFADGTAIGSAIASGTTTTVTTNGTFDLTDGSHAITAKQTESGRTESAGSTALNITVDTVAPTADIVDVTPDPRDSSVGSMTITFSRAVTGFDLSDLTLTRDGGANLLTGTETLTSGDNVTFTLGNLDGITDAAGTYVLTLTAAGSNIADSLAGNALTTNASDTWVRQAPSDTTPPTVTQVFVGSSSWAGTFNNFLATSGAGESPFGFKILATEQTDELPWTNLNTVSIRFSEDVVVAQDDLNVRGVNVATYAIQSFAYDAATFTATWTLATTGIANDKLLLELDADAGTGVTDATGNRLDGEWSNPVAPAISADAYPSGDGSAGGDFLFRLNVLPGDVNRSGGSITGSDVTLVRNAQNFSPGTAGYSILKDVNGTGSILGSDVTLVRNRQGISLPAGEPSVPAPIVQQTTVRKLAAVAPVSTILTSAEPLKKPLGFEVRKPL